MSAPATFAEMAPVDVMTLVDGSERTPALLAWWRAFEADVDHTVLVCCGVVQCPRGRELQQRAEDLEAAFLASVGLEAVA